MLLVHDAKRARVRALLAILALAGFTGPVLAVHAATARAAALITDAIDETNLVRLAGQTHPLASHPYDQGAVNDNLAMDHMFLQLQRSPEREESLALAIRQRQDGNSADYHHWFTAKELGERFGPAQQDVETVSNWLRYHGFTVNAVSRNGLTLDVSGTAGQVRETFHTEIHHYLVNGKTHIANASDPAIPAALAPVVVGMVALHDFMPRTGMVKPMTAFSLPCSGCPGAFSNRPQYDESPSDFAVIYNVGPLYKQRRPITGKGQTVAVLEDSNANPADIATFRKAFGLSSYAGTFSQIHPGPGCADPGVNYDEGEAALDAEWAGGVAAEADVEVASCADTTTNFGGFIAAQNLLDSEKPPAIISLSYFACESANGPSGNAYINALWQQAAAEGVSVFVDAGDGGPADCDIPGLAPYASHGIAVNGFGSTPYNVAVGGTDFLDTYEGKVSEYWNSSNNPMGRSAKSYIPEMAWNASCGSSEIFLSAGYFDSIAFCNSEAGSAFLTTVSGGGAPSFVYAKPYWQTATVGVPMDGKRDLPDVSLFAGNAVWLHDVLLCNSDTAHGGAPCDYTNGTDTLYNSAGGTSFSAPQMASIQALINQKAGGAQGNPNPILYALAKKSFGTSSNPDRSALSACNASQGNSISSACIFHDITAGNNAVPCYGPVDCYAPIAGGYGILSTSDIENREAYRSNPGWDFATGLGTIDVTNLVNRWP